jgi:PAS domain S-box-containing protein
MRRMKESALPYALAILATLAALFLRGLLNPFLGQANPYHTLWLAVVFSAWYCGIGPSVVTIAIGVTGIWYWFLPPYGSFASKDPTAISGVLGFMALSAVIVALGASTRRNIRQRKLAEEDLRKAQHELEERVRERTEALRQKTAEVVEKAALLDLANDAIFIRTVSGTISYWNHGAERLYGWSAAEAVGRSPHELLRTEFPVPFHEIETADTWAGELRHNKRDGTRIVVASRWTTLRDHDGKAAGWLEINTDITARKQAEDAARSLSGRILTLQDDERRRIARDLHDSLGQYLAALKLSLASLSTADGRQGAVDECFEIVDRCIAETRTISHLLHPPLLDEVGFGSAARWFVEGFAKRSGITVNLDLSPEVGRLHKDAEIGLFRTVQETLTNVHRHSGGSAVEISLRILGEQLRLEITDNGRGISEDRLRRLREGDSASGVGIAGMRERVRELGGSLEIESGRAGTKVILSVPVDRVSTGSSPSDRSGQSISVA